MVDKIILTLEQGFLGGIMNHDTVGEGIPRVNPGICGGFVGASK